MTQEVTNEKIIKLIEKAIKEKDLYKVMVLSFYHKDLVEKNDDLLKQIEDLYIEDFDPKYAICFLADYEKANEDRIVQNIVDEKKVVEELYFLANKLNDHNYEKIKNLILTYGDESDIYAFANNTEKDLEDFIEVLSYSKDVQYSTIYVEKLKEKQTKTKTTSELNIKDEKEETIINSSDGIYDLSENWIALTTKEEKDLSATKQILGGIKFINALDGAKKMYPDLKQSYNAFTSSFYKLYDSLTRDIEKYRMEFLPIIKKYSGAEYNKKIDELDKKYEPIFKKYYNQVSDKIKDDYETHMKMYAYLRERPYDLNALREVIVNNTDPHILSETNDPDRIARHQIWNSNIPLLIARYASKNDMHDASIYLLEHITDLTKNVPYLDFSHPVFTLLQQYPNLFFDLVRNNIDFVKSNPRLVYESMEIIGFNYDFDSIITKTLHDYNIHEDAHFPKATLLYLNKFNYANTLPLIEQLLQSKNPRVVEEGIKYLLKQNLSKVPDEFFHLFIKHADFNTLSQLVSDRLYSPPTLITQIMQSSRPDKYKLVMPYIMSSTRIGRDYIDDAIGEDSYTFVIKYGTEKDVQKIANYFNKNELRLNETVLVKTLLSSNNPINILNFIKAANEIDIKETDIQKYFLKLDDIEHFNKYYYITHDKKFKALLEKKLIESKNSNYIFSIALHKIINEGNLSKKIIDALFKYCSIEQIDEISHKAKGLNSVKMKVSNVLKTPQKKKKPPRENEIDEPENEDF